MTGMTHDESGVREEVTSEEAWTGETAGETPDPTEAEWIREHHDSV